MWSKCMAINNCCEIRLNALICTCYPSFHKNSFFMLFFRVSQDDSNISRWQKPTEFGCRIYSSPTRKKATFIISSCQMYAFEANQNMEPDAKDSKQFKALQSYCWMLWCGLKRFGNVLLRFGVVLFASMQVEATARDSEPLQTERFHALVEILMNTVQKLNLYIPRYIFVYFLMVLCCTV